MTVEVDVRRIEVLARDIDEINMRLREVALTIARGTRHLG